MKNRTKNVTKLTRSIECNGLEVRPNASDGLWCAFLLPSCILIAALKNPISIGSNYKCWSLFSFGLFVITIPLVISLRKRKTLPAYYSAFNILTALSTSVLFHVCLHYGYVFSIYSGVLCTVVYRGLYSLLLNTFPRCFTLGEAAIVTQGILLFLYSMTRNVYHAAVTQIKTPMQTASLIIQLSLCGICVTYMMVHKLNITKPQSFYSIVTVMLILTVFLPLHALLLQSPILWIIHFIISDMRRIKLMLLWIVCSSIGALAVSRQVWHAKRATTSTRKVFHILLCMVSLPGLFMGCTLLYLATGMALGVFVALELLRAQDIPPIGSYLQNGYVVFRDEKDTGLLALTPIYLLIGCSLPLWIHPIPCDITDSTAFTLLPLLSGLLSIGIGDTAASVFGSCYGIHKWNGTNKSIEGTLAYVLSQIGVIGLMLQLGFIEQLKTENLIRLILGVTITSLVEAKTTQIDNLTLPFIMFVILI